MDNLNTVKWMTKAIEKAARSVTFCVGGTLPPVDPAIEVDGVGAIKLPLKPKTARQLISACKIAPYGKGTRTLVDKHVRNTLELDPRQFQLGTAWDDAIRTTTAHVAEQLGLPASQLQAKLYKLLVYERGGFFQPHRDSEKLNRMLATLVVVLPTPFSGGALVVRHQSDRQTFRFEEAASGKAANYVAFYADCEHEVQRVTQGYRLCLTYNLVLKADRRAKKSPPAASTTPAEVLASSIGGWVSARQAEPLVFALEHHYTQRGLTLDLLKGADRSHAKLILSAAEKANCRVHLAQVTRRLCQYADDGSFERRWSRGPGRPQNLTIGEVYEDDLRGTTWTDVAGKRQPFGDLPFDVSAIVSSVPLDAWSPTSEEYEGYTGNAGNTLDRWYHRSARLCGTRITITGSSPAAARNPALSYSAR